MAESQEARRIAEYLLDSDSSVAELGFASRAAAARELALRYQGDVATWRDAFNSEHEERLKLLTEQDELREALAKTQAELWKLQGDPYAQAPVEAEAPERGER